MRLAKENALENTRLFLLEKYGIHNRYRLIMNDLRFLLLFLLEKNKEYFLQTDTNVIRLYNNI